MTEEESIVKLTSETIPCKEFVDVTNVECIDPNLLCDLLPQSDSVSSTSEESISKNIVLNNNESPSTLPDNNNSSQFSGNEVFSSAFINAQTGSKQGPDDLEINESSKVEEKAAHVQSVLETIEVLSKLEKVDIGFSAKSSNTVVESVGLQKVSDVENPTLEKSLQIKSDSEALESTLFLDDAARSLDSSTTSATRSSEELLSELDAELIEDCSNVNINGFTGSVLVHPAYKTLVQEVYELREKTAHLEKETQRQECEIQRLEADRSPEIYQVQLETLERTIAQQQREYDAVTERSRQQEELFSQAKADLESQLEKMTKQYESANRDKESMVIRYATSEKEVILQRKEMENLDRKLKESNKEKEILTGKVKMLNSEKKRLCQIVDGKCVELKTTQQDFDRLKEELNSREIKIKWAQNKLKSEIDTHKETQIKLERTQVLLQQAREECEQVRRDCQEMLRAFQSSEQNRAVTLDAQVKEQAAQLIVERHEKEDEQQSRHLLQRELDMLRAKQQILIEENNTLSVKVQNLEKERLEYESNLSRLKLSLSQQKQELVDLQGQVAEMEALRSQLQHEQERLSASQSEVDRLRESNMEMQQDMAACREREAELLDFTQKLTDKNVRLQSEFSATEAKASQLEEEQTTSSRRISELEQQLSTLQGQLVAEEARRREESQLLARHLAERSQRSEKLALQLEDATGDNQVLRRKHTSSVRELTREVQHLRRKLEQYQSSGESTSAGGSRASSNTSLNTLEATRPSASVNSVPSQVNASQHQQTASNPLEPDRQQLIERIVRLQRANARKSEKIDFLEEHVRQLVNEIQKKSKLIQNYVMTLDPGALTSNSADRNKAELTKHGGIMASVYSSRAVDNGLTLELSLEINKKLQLVLEDTLLKNITLKENINTLGEEIAKLTHENRRLQSQKT